MSLKESCCTWRCRTDLLSKSALARACFFFEVSILSFSVHGKKYFFGGEGVPVTSCFTCICSNFGKMFSRDY